jgi:hypothetical protein
MYPHDPLVPLAHLATGLGRALALSVLATLIGRAVAFGLRAAGLRWTWSLAGLVPAPALASGDPLWGLCLVVAVVTSARHGRRWHRVDVATGGDIARAAAGRRGPWDVAVVLTRRLAAQRARPLTDAGLLVGRDDGQAPVRIPLAGPRGGSHTLVVGTTGSGKTVTQASIAEGAIEAGLGCVVVDPKGDPLLRDVLREAAARGGRRFVEWTPDGPSVYNPFARGSETEIADKAIATERFTEPHYQRQAQRYLGHVVRVLRGTDTTTSLAALVRHLDPPALELTARRLPAETGQPVFDYLDSLTARQVRDLAGVRDRLAVLAESDAGRWLDPAGGGPVFDLLSVVRGRDVAYLRLDADRRPLLAQMLGAAIVQDLITTVAALQARPVPCLAVIDEFAAVSAGQVARLFPRARSALMNVVLGAQELSDLRVAGHDRLLEQVLGNVAALVAHRQVVPESIDLVVRLSGTRGGWSAAQRPDGGITRTRVDAPLLAAEDLRELPAGTAAVLLTGAGGAGRARVTRMLGPGLLRRRR